MRIEYQIIVEEFDSELSAIMELADAVQIGSTFSSRARTSLANSLTLILASVFEECVRQLVKAAWGERAKVVQDVRKLPEKLRSKLWRSTLERVAKQSFSQISAQPGSARDRIQNIMEFCIDGNLEVPVGDEIAHNDTNMRPDQIVELFSKIGMSNIFVKGCHSPAVLEFFACETANKAAENLRAELNEFFQRRNEVAHAVVFGSSSGVNALQRDIDVCRLKASVLANAADQFVEP